MRGRPGLPGGVAPGWTSRRAKERKIRRPPKASAGRRRFAARTRAALGWSLPPSLSRLQPPPPPGGSPPRCRFFSPPSNPPPVRLLIRGRCFAMRIRLELEISVSPRAAAERPDPESSYGILNFSRAEAADEQLRERSECRWEPGC